MTDDRLVMHIGLSLYIKSHHGVSVYWFDAIMFSEANLTVLPSVYVQYGGCSII